MRKQICFVMALIFLVVFLSACASPAPEGPETPEISETPQGGQEESVTAPDASEIPGLQPVEVSIRCSVTWEKGAQQDQEIADTVRDYLFLLEQAIATPDDIPESASCCTDHLLQEAYLYGFYMMADLSYDWIKVQAELNDLRFPADDTATVTVHASYDKHFRGSASEEDTDPIWLENVWDLHLNKTENGWVVADDEQYGTDVRWSYQLDQMPKYDLTRQTVDSYFQMRADEIAGAMGESGYTVSPLLADARDFAESLNYEKVYSVKARAGNFSKIYGIPESGAVGAGDYDRFMVTEYLLVDYWGNADPWNEEVENGWVRTVLQINHALTLQVRPGGGALIVTGDLYSYGDHQCNILSLISD